MVAPQVPEGGIEEFTAQQAPATRRKRRTQYDAKRRFRISSLTCTCQRLSCSCGGLARSSLRLIRFSPAARPRPPAVGSVLLTRTCGPARSASNVVPAPGRPAESVRVTDGCRCTRADCVLPLTEQGLELLLVCCLYTSLRYYYVTLMLILSKIVTLPYTAA